MWHAHKSMWKIDKLVWKLWFLSGDDGALIIYYEAQGTFMSKYLFIIAYILTHMCLVSISPTFSYKMKLLIWLNLQQSNKFFNYLIKFIFHQVYVHKLCSYIISKHV